MTNKVKGEYENAASRATDPDSSHLAEEHINRTGMRGERCEQILRVLSTIPGSTGGEIGVQMYYTYPEIGMKAAVTSPSKRLADLEHAGFVIRGEKRKCSDTKMTCVTWLPTNAGLEALGLKGQANLF